MNRYEPHTPRATFGAAAMAISAIVLGVLVIAPATMDARADGSQRLAAITTAAPTEVAIIPAQIEVVGVRQSRVGAGTNRNVTAFNAAWISAGAGKPDCKPAT